MACEYLSDKVISVAALLIKQQKANLANRIVLDYHNHLEQSKDMSCEEKEKFLKPMIRKQNGKKKKQNMPINLHTHIEQLDVVLLMK